MLGPTFHTRIILFISPPVATSGLKPPSEHYDLYQSGLEFPDLRKCSHFHVTNKFDVIGDFAYRRGHIDDGSRLIHRRG